jgi:hypothetical protein
LGVYGAGRKTVAFALFIGFFQCTPNSMFPINFTNGRWYYQDI